MRYFEITVQGRGVFPLDMLRFGQLWPFDIEAVQAMEQDPSLGLSIPAMRDIRLCTYGGYMKEHAIIQRFASFGWNAETTMVDDDNPTFSSVELREG